MTTFVSTGSFTNVASRAFYVPLEQKIDRFDLVNLSVLATPVSGRIVRASFYPAYQPSGTATVETVAGGPVSMWNLAQNGFTLFNAANPPAFAPVAIASFVPGTTTTFTTGAAHGLSVGDDVRIYGMTTAPQFGGLVMTVTAVGSTTTFTTLLNSTNGLTSVGFVQKIGRYDMPRRSLYYPINVPIAAVSLANPMVVTTLLAQQYQVGDVVRFAIPKVFGMQNLNTTSTGLPVQFTVSAVNNAIGTQTVTFENTNSLGFTAFSWPALATAGTYPSTFPFMIPQGEGNTNNFVVTAPSPLPYANQDILGFAKQNQGSRGILIGAGDGTQTASTGGIIGATGDVWAWTAFTASQNFPEPGLYSQ